jgi:CBS domain-containing protein
MTPVEKLQVAHPDQDIMSVLEQMDESNINQMPVVNEGRIIGLVVRENVFRFLHTRSRLGI